MTNGSRDIRRAGNRAGAAKYKKVVEEKDTLYDIFETDSIKRKDKESEMEMMYLENMRGDRKMECGG